AGQIILADKNYYGREFESALAVVGFACCGPPARASLPAPGPALQAAAQVIESVHGTFNGQLDLERHGGHHSPEPSPGSCSASSPSAPRSAPLHTGQPAKHSLVAYRH